MDDDDDDGPAPVMQLRCVHCGREQYAPAVFRISVGELGCAWCEMLAPVFTEPAEYWAAVKARHDNP